ncbi:ANTAR domain-containing protein [Streptomyces collinus]|uniref:ANTAR domain-containing protein n=1 Tax=Streptomyces collinus TaxID=42684 RepID=UPI0037CDBA62
MMTFRAQRPLPDTGREDAVARLEGEVVQLRRAVDSHATVDQAIGVLIAVYRIVPEGGFEVLREVSQHTNIKVRALAEMVIGWGMGAALPPSVAGELDEAVERHPRADGHRESPQAGG